MSRREVFRHEGRVRTPAGRDLAPPAAGCAAGAGRSCCATTPAPALGSAAAQLAAAEHGARRAQHPMRFRIELLAKVSLLQSRTGYAGVSVRGTWIGRRERARLSLFLTHRVSPPQSPPLRRSRRHNVIAQQTADAVTLLCVFRRGWDPSMEQMITLTNNGLRTRLLWQARCSLLRALCRPPSRAHAARRNGQQVGSLVRLAPYPVVDAGALCRSAAGRGRREDGYRRPGHPDPS